MSKEYRIEVKNNRKRNKEFKSLFKTVLSKIRRLKMHKPTKALLVSDLYECNNIDLLHYLSKETFSTPKAYFECINAFLDLECKAFDFPHTIVYKIGYMGNITEAIRRAHQAKDIRTKLGAQILEQST